MNSKIIGKYSFITLVFCLLPSFASASGWAIFSEHERMKGYSVEEVGNVSKVEPPFNTTWEEDVYQMNGRCFLLPSYMGIWGIGDKSGLLLVNAQKIIQLALIESSIGSIKVEMESVNMVECPSGTNVIPYSSDPEERLRMLKQQQEELKRKLELLRQHQ